MTAKRQSPLKLKDVIAQTKKLDVMSTYTYDEENKKVIKYNEVFDKTQVEKLIIELFEDMKYAVNNDYNYFENDEQLIKYELLLVIKYFSHFKDEIGDSFEDKISALEALMRTGIYDLFFEEIFDKDQVVNVIDHINNVAEKAIIANEAIQKATELNGESK